MLNNQTNYSEAELKTIFRNQKWVSLNVIDAILVGEVLGYSIKAVKNLAFYYYPNFVFLKNLQDTMSYFEIVKGISHIFVFYILCHILINIWCKTSLPCSIIDLADHHRLALTKEHLLAYNKKGIYQQYLIAQIIEMMSKNNLGGEKNRFLLITSFVWLNHRKIFFRFSYINALISLVVLVLIDQRY